MECISEGPRSGGVSGTLLQVLHTSDGRQLDDSLLLLWLKGVLLVNIMLPAPPLSPESLHVKLS